VGLVAGLVAGLLSPIACASPALSIHSPGDKLRGRSIARTKAFVSVSGSNQRATTTP